MFAWLMQLIVRLLSVFWRRKARPADMTNGPFPGRPNLPPRDSRDKVDIFSTFYNDGGGRGPHQPPRDPYSQVREPRPRRPNSDSAAVAVPEPDERETTLAVGGSIRT
jgi:hypothetical protein